MLLIPLQPQQPMNPCSRQAIFRPHVHIHCAIQLETLVRSDGIGVELLQIDTFLSQKLPFHSIIIPVKMVAYSGIFKKNYSLLRPCSF